MEPIFFFPIFKEYIWGGTKLKEVFNKSTELSTIAESWEIAANSNGNTKIQNGTYQGKTLQELYEEKEARIPIFGTKLEKEETFPLLIKLIDANQNLSIQVHPDNEYAEKMEHSKGKTEMWYIVDCKENAKIIYGLKKNLNKELFQKAIKEKKIQEQLNYVSVEKGDVIYIPAGTVHAILEGILICEIQQNSDITYRVYDWERLGKDNKPRQLHINQALDVIQFEKEYEVISTKQQKETIKRIMDSDYFKVDKIIISSKFYDDSNPESFSTINVINGKGLLKCNEKEYPLTKGTSFLLPAQLGAYEIEGNLEILRSSV